jgi:hypothetical protein
MNDRKDKKTETWARLRLSLDAWAVASALAAALLVRAGVLKHVPW